MELLKERNLFEGSSLFADYYSTQRIAVQGCTIFFFSQVGKMSKNLSFSLMSPSSLQNKCTKYPLIFSYMGVSYYFLKIEGRSLAVLSPCTLFTGVFVCYRLLGFHQLTRSFIDFQTENISIFRFLYYIIGSRNACNIIQCKKY